MSNKNYARRTVVKLYFKGADISKELSKYLLSLSFTDKEEDETDDISLSLDDREGKWIKDWLNTSKAVKTKTETVTTGGGEIKVSEESYTTAGPRGSYIYHAKAVSSQISDVSAESPQDGVADIRIMLYGGELPSEELIKEVQAYLSADDIRPMTDKVTVAAPTTVDFDIELTYYIPKDKEASTKEIKRAVDLAVESYELWQTSKMGRDINPSYFYAILMDSGIKRADIKKPVFTEIPKGSVAVLKKCTVTFGGVEDE